MQTLIYFNDNKKAIYDELYLLKLQKEDQFKRTTLIKRFTLQVNNLQHQAINSIKHFLEYKRLKDRITTLGDLKADNKKWKVLKKMRVDLYKIRLQAWRRLKKHSRKTIERFQRLENTRNESLNTLIYRLNQRMRYAYNVFSDANKIHDSKFLGAIALIVTRTSLTDKSIVFGNYHHLKKRWVYSVLREKGRHRGIKRNTISYLFNKANRLINTAFLILKMNRQMSMNDELNDENLERQEIEKQKMLDENDMKLERKILSRFMDSNIRLLGKAFRMLKFHTNEERMLEDTNNEKMQGV